MRRLLSPVVAFTLGITLTAGAGIAYAATLPSSEAGYRTLDQLVGPSGRDGAFDGWEVEGCSKRKLTVVDMLRYCVIPKLNAGRSGTGPASTAPQTPSAPVTSTPSPPSAPPSPPPPAPTGSVNSCTDPAFSLTGPDDGRTVNGYYVHNNMWNAQGGSQRLSACSEKSWYVDASNFSGTEVKTYPNVHKDINNLNGSPLSSWSSITSTFAGKGPGKGIYNVAYDLWLNGVGWGRGHTEMMVWTENFKQRPAGDDLGVDFTSDGKVYDVWRCPPSDCGGMNVVTFVSQITQPAGSVNLKSMIDWAIGRSYIPPNPTVNQIGYGIEFCDTAGTSRFAVSDFSVAMR